MSNGKLRVALVDFDGTIIPQDSLKYLAKRERIFFIPRVFLFGVLLFVVSYLAPKSVPARRSALKKEMLLHIRSLPREKIDAYTGFFAESIRRPLAQHIENAAYDSIVIASASERHIISETLMKAGFRFNDIIANDWDNLDDFRTCWGSEKARRVKEKFSSNNCSFTVYTDSRDDEPLMKLADKVYNEKVNDETIH